MEQIPTRGEKHKALEVFLGKWTARGTSYGNTDQSGPDTKANGQPWFSIHEGRWHSGSFFLIQDEWADIEGYRFDTLSVMGMGEGGEYFARSFENHGFYRHYQVTRDGSAWQLSGASERATIRFSDGGRRQAVSWEWKRQDVWLPLCDRTAVRTD
jgi:hypothetical protein